MIQAESGIPEGRRGSRRTIVPVLILVVMFATMAAVGTFAYKEIREDVLNLSDSLFKAHSERIEADVRGYFQPASELVSLLASISREDDFRAAPGILAETVAVGVLSHYPQISSFLIGDEYGNSVRADRQPNGTVYTRFIERTDSGAQGRWIFRDSDGRVTRWSNPEPDEYDPRQRPWYDGADRAQGLYWSDVYNYHSSGIPGLTVAAPILDDLGITLGVVGADIQLSTLSVLLGELEVSEHGIAIIVDDEGRLVAHPSLDKVVIQGDSGAAIAKVEELGDAVLERAHKRFQVESHGARPISVADTTYVTEAVSLLEAVGQDWTIIFAAPEDDFAGFLARDFQVLLLLAGSVVVLGAALAGLLMVQGRRADRNARLVREGQAELDAQMHAFSELAELVAGFEVGEELAETKLTEIVAHATGVSRMSVWRYDADEVLRCVDCFETATRGHTAATELHRSEIEFLVSKLQQGEEVAAPNAATNEVTEALHRLYLRPMDCNALLASPVRVGGGLLGVLMLEDQSASRAWTSRETSFLRAVGSMIAARMRDAELAASIRAEGATIKIAANADDSGQVERVAAREHPASVFALRNADLGQGRFERFTTSLADKGLCAADSGTDLFRTATVAVLSLDDPFRLAASSRGDSGTNTIDEMVRTLEELGAELDVRYLKIAGEEIIFAAGLGNDPEEGARRIAKMALGARDFAVQHPRAGGERLEFRLGLDSGPAMGAAVGHEARAYNLWGEAVQIARSMAESGVAGCIQVSETTYELLRDDFLFRARGRFYTEACGETGTYILTDHL